MLEQNTRESQDSQIIITEKWDIPEQDTNQHGYTFTAAITIDPSDGSMDGVLTSQNDLPFVSTSGAAVYSDGFVFGSVFSFEFFSF